MNTHNLLIIITANGKLNKEVECGIIQAKAAFHKTMNILCALSLSMKQRVPESAITLSSEENISLLPEDIAGDNIMSTCSDAGYTSQDSCSETYRQMTQPMSLEQNLSNNDSRVDADIYTDVADGVGIYNLDVILCQFDTFFRSRLDSELEAFQETMHSLLTEQQIHIQRIINSSFEHSLNEFLLNLMRTAQKSGKQGAHVMTRRAKLKWV